jgi:transposase
LTLEDVSQKAVSKKKVSKRKSTALSSGDQMVNLMMVETLELFHQQLKRRKKDLRSEDISMILEVLAERYFSFVSFRQWKQ